MTHSILLASPLFLFVGKMFACGILGCMILGALRMVIELKMNPKGWKSGKEFCNSNPDEFEQNYSNAEENLIPQRVPVKYNRPISKRED